MDVINNSTGGLTAATVARPYIAISLCVVFRVKFRDSFDRKFPSSIECVISHVYRILMILPKKKCYHFILEQQRIKE